MNDEGKNERVKRRRFFLLIGLARSQPQQVLLYL